MDVVLMMPLETRTVWLPNTEQSAVTGGKKTGKFRTRRSPLWTFTRTQTSDRITIAEGVHRMRAKHLQRRVSLQLQQSPETTGTVHLGAPPRCCVFHQSWFNGAVSCARMCRRCNCCSSLTRPAVSLLPGTDRARLRNTSEY